MNMMAPIDTTAAEPRSLLDRLRRLPRWQRRASALVPVTLVAAAGATLLGTPEPAPAVQAPPVVTVATPLVREIDEWESYIGRFAPSRSVEIRPRVSGEVTGVHFRDGQVVRKGELLFTIDERPFAAALAEARANAASAASTLALARTDLARALRLIDDEAVSAAEVDELRARVQAAEAALAAAQARVRSRALDVEFTRVRAPIAGRISDRRVDPGNQVAGGEGTGGTVLTSINALDPIYFTFDASEALFLKAQRARADARDADVELRLQDEPDFRWKGKLDFTDNGFDRRSGTIRGRAVLANPNHFLAPGMFGNMRLSHGTAQALLIPDAAIQADQARKVVLAVGPGNVVTAKPVELGPLIGELRVIRSGLVPADRIVIQGTQMAMPGAKVEPRRGEIAMTAAPPPPAPRAPSGEATLASR